MKFSRITAALALVLMLLTSTVVWAAQGGTGEIIIFHTNDMHARMKKGDDNGSSIGLAEMAAAVKAVKKEHPQTLWLDAGDTIHGMPLINVSRGANAVPLLNEAGINAMSPGNHDFNYSAARLFELSPKMKFPVLCANLVDRETGKNLFPPYKIFKLGDVKVGVFGMTTPETPYKTNPNNVKGLEFLNPVEVAGKMVKELKPQCDVVVAVMHMGVDKSSEYTSERIAREVTGIDLIVDGHSHTTLPEGLTVGDTLIVQTGWHEYRLGRATITVENHRVTGKKAQLLNAADVERIAPVPDKAVAKTMGKIEKRNEKLFSQVVAHSDRSLSSERQLVRCHEAELGNLSADAVRWCTGADIAVVNGGGLRSDLPAGNVTAGDMMAIYPFGNTVCSVKIPGKTIREMLEHSVFAYPAAFGGFLQVSGLTFSFDPSKPLGHRVSSIRVGGVPLDENKTYTMGTNDNDFFHAGGDDYTMLKDLPLTAEFGTCEEVLADYLNQVGMKGIETGRITVINDVQSHNTSNAINGEEDLREAA